MSPLRRAETYLAVRLLELERRLPPGGVAAGQTDDADLWRDYVDTVAVFAQIRAQLYYAPAPAAVLAPHLPRPRAGIR